MPAPIPFSDIGKTTKDLLGKDFPVGSVALEVKTTAANGVQFTVSGNKDNVKGNVNGDLKIKYTDKVNGVAITEGWSSSSVLSLDADLTDTITKGLKLGVSGSLLPSGDTKNAKVSVDFKQDFVTTRANLDLFRGPVLAGDIVFGTQGYLAGGEVAYNIADGKVAKYALAGGFNGLDWSVSVAALNNLKAYTASYHHRVSPDVEVGARTTFDTKAEGKVALELGTKYILDRDAFVKAKVDTDARFGLGYTQLVRPGVKVAVGGSFDTARLNENVHKLGMAITFEA